MHNPLYPAGTLSHSIIFNSELQLLNARRKFHPENSVSLGKEIDPWTVLKSQYPMLLKKQFQNDRPFLTPQGLPRRTRTPVPAIQYVHACPSLGKMVTQYKYVQVYPYIGVQGSPSRVVLVAAGPGQAISKTQCRRRCRLQSSNRGTRFHTMSHRNISNRMLY